MDEHQPRSRSRASTGARRERPSSRASVMAGSGGGDLAATAAWHRDDLRRNRGGAAAGPGPRTAAGALRAWLPADTLALCGAEAPLFLALDKLDAMVLRVRGEGKDAQASLLKSLDASLQARGLARTAAMAVLRARRAAEARLRRRVARGSPRRASAPNTGAALGASAARCSRAASARR